MSDIIAVLKYLATSNFINFSIMIIIFGVIIKKLNVKAALNASIEKVATEVKNSETKKSDSEKKLRTIHTAMEKLPQKIEKYNKEIQSRTESLKEKIQENANSTISNLQNNIGKELELEEKRLSGDLQEFTLDSSIEIATNNICETLKNNPELHIKFIDKSLEDFNKVELK